MTDTKISALTELTAPAAGDFIPIVDTTATQTKKIDYSLLTNVFDVRANGAKGDSGTTDNRTAIQAALDAAETAGGGTVVVPMDSSGGDYWYSPTLTIGDGVTLLVDSGVKMVVDTTVLTAPAGWTAWPMKSCILTGAYNQPTYDQLASDGDALDLPVVGVPSVTTTTAGDAGNYSAGEVVFIRSTTLWTRLTVTWPLWGQTNVVETVNAGTGVITLRHPIEEAGAAEIVSFSNSGYNILTAGPVDTGVLTFFSKDVRIKGGDWVNQAGGAFSVGNTIDSVIDVHSFVGRNMPGYGNLTSKSFIKCQYAECTYASIEFARQSHNNVCEYGEIYCDDSEAGSLGDIIFVEGSRDNHVKVNSITTERATGAVVLFDRTYRNTIEIDRIIAIDNAQPLVKIIRTAPTTGTAPDTYDNSISVKSALGGSSSYYITITADETYRNRVTDSRFFGTVSSNAINDATTTTGLKNLISNVYFDDGGIDRDSPSDDSVVLHNSYLPDLAALHNHYVGQGFQGSTFTDTISVPAGTLYDENDIIEGYFSLELLGAVVDATSSFVGSFAGTNFMSVSTIAADVPITIDIRFQIKTNGAGTAVFTNWEYVSSVQATSVVGDHRLDSLTKASINTRTTAYDLVITFDPQTTTTAALRWGRIRYLRNGKEVDLMF